MFTNNAPGLYPTVLVHRSHAGQLAIAGAVINRVEDNPELIEAFEACPQSGGWRTRFDGGSRPGLDLPCEIVAMYVEGLIHITGSEGAYDSWIVTEPQCFAVVHDQWTDERVYLRSRFSFVDRVVHDGVYDLADARAIVNGIPVTERDLNSHSRRNWQVVRKSQVPGRVRQILHRAVRTANDIVNYNFGQGKDFFELPQRRKQTV